MDKSRLSARRALRVVYRHAARHLPGAGRRALRRGALAVLVVGALACAPAPSAPPPAALAPAASGAAPASAPGGPAPGAPAAATAQPRPDRIVMSYSATSSAFLTMFVAQDQGFYARNGLDAELVQAAAQVGIAGMVNGDVDFSLSLGSFARAAARGLPVRILEQTGRAPQLYLVSQPDVPTMADLRGKVLSPISLGGTNSQTATLLLRKHGVDPQTVQYLAGGDAPRQLEMLRQRQVDAALISPPYPLIAQRDGYRLLANAQEEISLAFTGLSASQDSISQRGDLVRRTIRAEIEALQFVHADREGTIRIIQQRFGSEPELATVTYDLIIGAFTTDGSVSREGIDNVLALDKEEGAVPESTTFEDVVDLRPLHDVQRAMGLLR